MLHPGCDFCRAVSIKPSEMNKNVEIYMEGLHFTAST